MPAFLTNILPTTAGAELFAATLVLGLLFAARRAVARSKPRSLS